MIDYIKAYALFKSGIPNFREYKNGKKLEQELVKYTNVDSVKVVDLPKEIYEPIDKTKILDNQVYKNTIRIFGNIIQKVIPEEYLDNYYRNFSNIQMKELTMIEMYSDFFKKLAFKQGLYDSINNTISFKDTFISSAIGAITHELLHASSTYYDKKRKIVYVGLSQMYIIDDKNKKSEIYGMALNEGYTQYLNNKYFVDQKSMTLNIFDKRYNIETENVITKKNTYKEEQIIAKALNDIIGEDKMISFYFRADLNGLVKELEKYQSRETIYRFINYTDTLCYYQYGKENIENEMVDEVKTFINSFLLSTFHKAKKDEIDEKYFEYFKNNCIPFISSKTHAIMVDNAYLLGEINNPLEKLSAKK